MYVKFISNLMGKEFLNYLWLKDFYYKNIIKGVKL